MATAIPAVNSARIDAAVEQHAANLKRIAALTETRKIAALPRKAWMSIEGDTGMPLEIGNTEALALIDAAVKAETDRAVVLATALNALSTGLPG